MTSRDAVVPFCAGSFKRMKKVGRTDAYANEDSTRVVVLCLLQLPLLPVNHTELTFQDVRATVGADTYSLQWFRQLLRYVEKQWLQKATIISYHA